MNVIGKNLYENLNLLPPDYQGWYSDSPVFNLVIEKTLPSVIVEVGTWKGASAINMADICKNKKLKTTIYCVDTWLGSEEFWVRLAHTKERDLLLKNGYPQIYYQFLSNVVHKNHQDTIIPVPNTSFIGSKILKSKNVKADLIYIDGSHEYEDVKLDISSYWDILKQNGIMFGDDYLWVKKAVDEYCETNKIALRVENNHNWIIRKK